MEGAAAQLMRRPEEQDVKRGRGNRCRRRTGGWRRDVEELELFCMSGISQEGKCVAFEAMTGVLENDEHVWLPKGGM